jgi:hypothetical protein
MARTETDFGGGVDKVFDNDFITRKELEDILKQRATTDRFYELEPLEVLDIFREGGEVSQPGAIIGRYVYSEQGDSVDECLEYLPLDSNIQQQAIVGEVYFGLSFKGQRYYFGRIANNMEEVNSQDFNISGLNDSTSIVGETTKVLNSDNVGKSPFKQGDTFVNDNPSKLLFSEGDTMIEGRFKNSIRLGNDDKSNSGNVKIVAGCETGVEDLSLDKSSLYMTSDEQVDYPEPVVNYIEKDYTEPQLILDSNRLILNAKTENVHISANNKVLIKGVGGVDVENAIGGVNLIAEELKRDYVGGLTKDINQDLSDPDKKLLPKQSIELAKQMEPFITYIKGEIQAMAYLLLPPSLPSGAPNPSFMLGMKIKFETLQKLLKKIKEFVDLDFLPKFDFETVSLNEFRKALGLDGLSIDFPTDEWDKFYNDIDGLKQKVLDIQNDIAVKALSIKALGDAFDAVQQGGGSIKSIIEALDAYEADPNNTPIDTTDIRAVINTDGVDRDDVQRYLEQGGSPQVQEALQKASTQKDEAEQLNQLVKIVELTKQ